MIFATALGAYLRLANLGQAPLWCDEAYFATHPFARHELLPGVVSQILGTHPEFDARLPFAIAGILTIPVIYWIKPGKWTSLAALFVAIFPLFVFYSRMCRPYAMAGLFIAIAWRWRWSYFLAILCNPVQIVGFDLTKAWKQRWFFVSTIGFAMLILLSRPDLGYPGFLTPQMFATNPRLWYVPLLTLVLYSAVYLLPWIEKRTAGAYQTFQAAVLVACSLLFFEDLRITAIKTGPPFRAWYSNIIFYNDWKGMPRVDLSTNFSEIAEYYTGGSTVLLRRTWEETADRTAIIDEPRRDSILVTRDTILVGVDSYANNLSRWFFPDELLRQYGEYLYDGHVLLVRLCRTADKSSFNCDVFLKPETRRD